VLQDHAGRAYTRVGTFGLDASESLVDQRTGLAVLGPDGQPVTVDTHTIFPPSATGSIEFAGNLPAVVTGPLAEVLTSSTGLKEGAPATLTAADPGPNYAVTAGATYTLEVVVSGAAPELVSVTDSDNDGLLTNVEIAAAIDAQEDVNAAVDTNGFIVVSTDRTGTNVSLRISPGASNDLADLINLSTTQVSGSETDVDATTDLNTLPGNVDDYQVGDEIDVLGVDTDGSPVNGTFVYGVDGTTVNEFIDFVDSLYTDADVSMNAAGQIVVEAQTPGEADLLLSISDDAAAAGSTQWSTYGVSVTTEGTGPDTVVASTEVFDPAGVAHTVTFTYERQTDGTWNMEATIPPEDGTVIDGLITGLTFGEDGSPSGLGSVDPRLSIQFAGQSSAQEIVVDFGTDGAFDGLTQFGGQSTAFVEGQDGYGDGELANLAVRVDGTIEGFYSNGQSRELGAVGIATFANPEGLHEVGSNLWVETSNSGGSQLGAGASAIAGDVIGGSLENSNVDTAEQFVHLIEAQRGFQASARVITAEDEVLREVVNLI
jgi:flagellar hook-basal body protein